MAYYYLPITLAAAASTTIHAGERDVFMTSDHISTDDLKEPNGGYFTELWKNPANINLESQSNIDPFDGLVTLNVYKLKLMKNKVKIPGIYHSGIEIDGKEFAFFKKGGIVQEATPKICRNPRWVIKKSYDLGHYIGTQKDAMDIIEGMKKDWTGKSYNTFTRNDNHFTNALSMALVKKPIPSYVKRLNMKAPTMKNPLKRLNMKAPTMKNPFKRSSVKETCQILDMDQKWIIQITKFLLSKSNTQSTWLKQAKKTLVEKVASHTKNQIISRKPIQFPGTGLVGVYTKTVEIQKITMQLDDTFSIEQFDAFKQDMVVGGNLAQGASGNASIKITMDPVHDPNSKTNWMPEWTARRSFVLFEGDVDFTLPVMDFKLGMHVEIIGCNPDASTFQKTQCNAINNLNSLKTILNSNNKKESVVQVLLSRMRVPTLSYVEVTMEEGLTLSARHHDGTLGLLTKPVQGFEFVTSAMVNRVFKLIQKDNFLNTRFIIPWIKRKFKAEAEFMLNKQANLFFKAETCGAFENQYAPRLPITQRSAEDMGLSQAEYDTRVKQYHKNIKKATVSKETKYSLAAEKLFLNLEQEKKDKNQQAPRLPITQRSAEEMNLSQAEYDTRVKRFHKVMKTATVSKEKKKNSNEHPSLLTTLNPWKNKNKSNTFIR